MKYSVFSGVLPELSAEEVCRRLAQHGYDGVEWRVDGEYHFGRRPSIAMPPRIKELCAAHGLEVAGLTSYVRPDEEDAVGRLIDACRTLGCPRFRIFSARYDPALGYFTIRDRTRVQLERLARRLEGTGVKALLEIHFGTIVASPALAFELLRDLDPATIGVILDPANLVIEGGMDLRMGLDMLGDRVDLVHVKNIRWERTPDGQMALALRRARGRPVRLGRGDRRIAGSGLRRLAVARESLARAGPAHRLCRRGPRRRVPAAARHRAAAARRARFPAPPLRLDGAGPKLPPVRAVPLAGGLCAG